MRKFLAVTMISMGLILSGTQVFAHHDTKEETEETSMFKAEFRYIFDIIRSEHVDEVDDKTLLEAAIRGMVKTLDKHSSYMNAEEYELMQQSMNDSFFGIGTTVEKDKETGFMRAVTPMDGSPAMKAGLKAGDLIISADDILIKPLTLREGVMKIRGPLGSPVKLLILRGKEKLTITVVRGKITSQVVSYKMLPTDIGYIRLGQFSTNATRRMAMALSALKREVGLGEHLNGLILDLRNNPGGLLTSAIDISDMFVKEGVIVSTRGRDAKNHSRTERASAPVIISMDIPIVVLINKGSASASEIVAGTLQDLGRATVMGIQSYGKGSVQIIMPLRTGGGLRLTRAKYYTASGKVIHGVGITPDVIVELPKDYKAKTSDEIDPQLQKAIEYIQFGVPKTDVNR